MPPTAVPGGSGVGHLARREAPVVAGAVARPGDAPAAVLDDHGRATGLLVAAAGGRALKRPLVCHPTSGRPWWPGEP